MKFGVREICDVVFKAKSSGKIGKYAYGVGQPVLYIDSAKTSTIEGAATTVYATGGKGNTRLVAWEGEKTLTFTVEDALLSPVGFSILSGAGLFAAEDKKMHVHKTANVSISVDGDKKVIVDLTDALDTNETVCANAPVFVMATEADGSIAGDFIKGLSVNTNAIDVGSGNSIAIGKALEGKGTFANNQAPADGSTVFVDFYVEKTAGVQEIVIDAGTFGGYYYVEASTLFRRQIDGKDLPAELVFPNVKIQSNFTFSMASTGDPSTFTFTMDAMPGYTAFDKTKKVLCVMQVVEDADATTVEGSSVMAHAADEDIKTSEEKDEDSVVAEQ